MNTVQANRLLNVAAALRDAHRAGWFFDMSSYGYEQGSYHADDKEDRWTEAHNCGTPACALGHYAARRDLQRVLYLRKDGDLLFESRRYGCNSVSHTSEEVLDHFGLTHDEANELFDSPGCGRAETPLEAARYIEGFLRRKDFVLTGSYTPTDLAA